MSGTSRAADRRVARIRALVGEPLDPDCGTPAYHMLTFRLDGPLDRELLESALRGVERRFDAPGDPAWRASLVRTDATCHHLVLTVHHTVDSSSVDMLRKELAESYAALACDTPEPAESA